MNIQDFGAIASMVSAIVVIISLIYLALELRQNTRALRSSAAWDAETVWATGNLEAARHPEHALLMSRASSVTGKLDDFNETEIAQLYLIFRGCLQIAQAQWWLWKGGSLPDEIWKMRRIWAANFIQPPVLNSIWQTELDQYVLNTEFVSDILAAVPDGVLAFAPVDKPK
jgi:hypothetical protein